MTRPSFINTKQERKEDEDQLSIPHILDFYRKSVIGHYEWRYNTDIIEMPEGWIEDTLFNYGNISAAKFRAPIGWFFTPVNPVTVDRYYRPYSWISAADLNNDADRAFLLKEQKNPVLDLGVSMAEQIMPYVKIMERCFKVLDMNVLALSQPVAIESAPGEIDGCIQEWDLKQGKYFMPVINKKAVGTQVLDLKAQDHTQNLASTIMFLNSKIMDTLCMPNANLKNSGVSDMETGNANVGTSVYNDWGLKRRMQWCDRMNDLYPELQLSVRVSESWDSPEGSEAEQTADMENIAHSPIEPSNEPKEGD